MPIRRRETALYLQALWLAVALVGMVVVDAFSVDLYVAAGVLGLLVTLGLTVDAPATRPWRDRLTRVAVAGLVAFGAALARRVFAALAPELI